MREEKMQRPSGPSSVPPVVKANAPAGAPVPAKPANPNRGAPPTPPSPPPAADDGKVAPGEFGDSIENALAGLLHPSPPPLTSDDRKAAAKDGTSTAGDLAALHATYAELAVEYCAPVRNVMIEVRWGEPPVRWLEHVKSALGSLRAMAVQVELAPLVGALDAFDAAVNAALSSGETTIGAHRRRVLLAAYAGLAACLPRAFDLEGERDRREPIILRSLLLMVRGVVPLTAERFLAAGLNRLEAIAKARAEEIAVVTQIPIPMAQQIIDLLRAEGNIGVANVAEERQRLTALVAELVSAHEAFERAAGGWSVESDAEKRRWRQQRELTLLRVQVSLARLGEVDRIHRLERLPFGRKIEHLQELLRAASSRIAASARHARRAPNGGKGAAA